MGTNPAIEHISFISLTAFSESSKTKGITFVLPCCQFTSRVLATSSENDEAIIIVAFFES